MAFPRKTFGEEGLFTTVDFENVEELVRKFEVRDDDVFIAAHPKQGTTWTQEMVWLIVNDLDYEGAKAFVDERIPILEFQAHSDRFPYKHNFYVDSIEYCNKLKSPRCMKSHLTWSLLPKQLTSGTKGAKLISIVRDPKDTFLSFYYYSQIFMDEKPPFDGCASEFINGTYFCGPYYKHVLSYWNNRNKPYVLVLKYEDMKRDLRATIKKTASFLDKPLSDSQVETLYDHLQFDNMKNNAAVNHKNLQQNTFMRKGKSGSYMEEMPKEWIEKFDAATKKAYEGTGLNY